MGQVRDFSGTALRVIARLIDAELIGDGEVLIDRVATLEHASAGAITFLSNAKYKAQLATTRASAVIVSPEHAAQSNLPRLVTRNPYATYAKVATLLNPPPPHASGTHPSAVVARSAAIAATAMIGPHAVIGERASIGERAQVHAGTVVGDDCLVADEAVLRPRVVLYAGTVIGARTLVHSGAVLGSDGFGMAQESGRWIKVPQLGRVVVGADVEIGANTTIDRGAIDDTVIEDDVKLDNQIQIGHNCRIGAHTAIAGCVGIAGSVNIGRNCQIGGAAMIAGHLDIADGTIISAASFVCDNIETPGIYTGAFPSLPHREWRHVASIIRRLRSFADRVKALERLGPGQGG